MKLHGIAQAINLLLSGGESAEGKALVYEDYITLGSQRLYFKEDWVIDEHTEHGVWTDNFDRLEDAVDKLICHSGE